MYVHAFWKLFKFQEWLCLSLANPGILGFARVFHTDIMFFSVDWFGAWHEGSGISACEKSLEWQRSLQLMLKLSQRSLEGNPGFKKRYGSGGLGKAQ